MVPERPLVDVIMFGLGLGSTQLSSTLNQLIATRLMCIGSGVPIVCRAWGRQVEMCGFGFGVGAWILAAKTIELGCPEPS
jgi:hypothetical protein